MRKIIAFVLCIVLCLVLLPVTAIASGTVQYAAVTATQENLSDAVIVTGFEDIAKAANETNCVAVIVYSLNATQETPATLSDDISIPGKSLALSNVALAGNAECSGLYLLGCASVTPTGVGYVITGTSNGGSAKSALTTVSLGSVSALMDAVDGAEMLYTVTGNASINEPLCVYDLVINTGATLTINASEAGNTNCLYIWNSLTVNGTLTAADGQILELDDNATISGDSITLYDSDGTTPYELPAEHGILTFEWNGTVWRLIGGGGEDSTPGALEGMDSVNQGDYIVSSNTSITSASSVNLNFGSITINEGVTLTVEAGGVMDLLGMTVTNNGTILIIADTVEENPNDGRVELRDDSYYDSDTDTTIVNDGILTNNGTIIMDGRLELNDGAELSNSDTGRFTINNYLRLSEGAVLSNSGSIIGGSEGRIELNDPSDASEHLTISGLSFYENAGDEVETTDLNGEFAYDDTAGKWVRANMGGETNTYTINASAGEGGSISPAGNITANEGEDWHFAITPAPGYKIASIWIDGSALDESELESLINGDGIANYSFCNVHASHNIKASFEQRDCIITTYAGFTGRISEPQTISPGGNSLPFTITPDEGFRISALTLSGTSLGEKDLMDELYDNGNGTYSVVVTNVTEDLRLSVTFQSIADPTLSDILQKSYAVLIGNAENAEEVKTALSAEIASIGYHVSIDNITVSKIELPGEGQDYGTFIFTVKAGGETSAETTGYIVKEFSDVIFKFSGWHGDEEVNEIRVAYSSDGALGEFEAPAMDTGTMEVFGVYNIRLTGLTSPDVRDAFSPGPHKVTLNKAFYRAQLHICNDYDNPPHGSPYSHISLNWFGFDLIQEDAYCVQVSASDGADEQKTLQWDLNRYAQLTTGNYTSEVFFGNDIFTLSPPSSGIGGISSLSVVTGNYPGYTVSDNGDGTYSVHFLSDFYDQITLELTINGIESRKLNIHRVGVQIEAYQPREDDQFGEYMVFHGTQFSTPIDYSDGMCYRIYATYCIPDGGEEAPYGLYVTYTWANGTTTTKIVTNPCNDSSPLSNGILRNGVFLYENHANCCDYLIYSAVNSTNAPIRINVTVLKADPDTENNFGGVFFGSGAGVEWTLD
jgi:hypothetical protein